MHDAGGGGKSSKWQRWYLAVCRVANFIEKRHNGYTKRVFISYYISGRPALEMYVNVTIETVGTYTCRPKHMHMLHVMNSCR